jgi:hypothetical protein
MRPPGSGADGGSPEPAGGGAGAGSAGGGGGRRWKTTASLLWLGSPSYLPMLSPGFITYPRGEGRIIFTVLLIKKFKTGIYFIIIYFITYENLNLT